MIPESICLMPWIHLYVDTNGNAKACCNTSITYGNVNNESIESIWNGESIKKFRKNLLEGQKDKRCASCFGCVVCAMLRCVVSLCYLC